MRCSLLRGWPSRSPGRRAQRASRRSLSLLQSWLCGTHPAPASHGHPGLVLPSAPETEAAHHASVQAAVPAALRGALPPRGTRPYERSARIPAGRPRAREHADHGEGASTTGIPGRVRACVHRGAGLPARSRAERCVAHRLLRSSHGPPPQGPSISTGGPDSRSRATHRGDAGRRSRPGTSTNRSSARAVRACRFSCSATCHGSATWSTSLGTPTSWRS